MKKYIAMLMLLGLGLQSCDSFLEEEPYDFLTPDNFYKNEKDATAALNGVFSSMQSQQYFGRTQWILTELTGDCMRTTASSGDRYELYSQTFSSTNGEISNWWVNTYGMIARANDVIENVPNIKMDEAKKNNILGNARFLRGMAYFDLVRSFGEVPLVLNTIKGPNDDLTPSRSSIADVYASIIEDLMFAEANCLAEDKIPNSEKGRVSSGAAASLLAKVYLTRASSAAAQDTDNQDALDACNRVINSNLYKVTGVAYSDVFSPDKENWNNVKEHIFDIQFDLPPNTGNITIRMHLPTSVGSGFGAFTAEDSLVFSYDPSDIRKDWNVSNQAGATTLSYYYFTKFRDDKRSGNNGRTNWSILRYADVLLLQSEAINKIDPSNADKFTGINTVRSRAGLAPLDFTTTPTQDDFIDALVQERAWEFCAEGLRRFDLLRLGRYKEAQLATYDRVVDDKYLLFPVPNSETSINNNLLPNNPGF